MADKPPKDEPGAQERFDNGVANALRMPPKPHKPVTSEQRAMMDKLPKKGRGPKAAPNAT